MHNNPVKLVLSLKENKGRTRYLSESEKARLLEVCKDSDWSKLHLLVNMAITSGARKGELLYLRWEDIELHNRTALIRDDKIEESNVLPLVDSVVKELSQITPKSSLLFNSEMKPGKPICFQKHWVKALKQAGISDFHFYDLRHSCASILAMSGATLFQISQVLGHKSMQTTARYSHFSTSHKA